VFVLILVKIETNVRATTDFKLAPLTNEANAPYLMTGDYKQI